MTGLYGAQKHPHSPIKIVDPSPVKGKEALILVCIINHGVSLLVVISKMTNIP